MPRLVSERIKKLREEIAEISEANRTHMHRRDGGAAADQERRLQRLQCVSQPVVLATVIRRVVRHVNVLDFMFPPRGELGVEGPVQSKLPQERSGWVRLSGI